MPNYKIGIDLEVNDKASGSLKKVSGAADSLDDAFGKTGSSGGGLGASLAGLVNPAALATTAVAAIGAAAVATAAHAMDLANQVEQSTASMTTQLALTEEEAVGFETTMRNIYAANYGASFDDISESLVAVESNFTRIGGTESQAQLEEITIKALSLRDAFDVGVNESASAAATLMENFGLTSVEAFDFLTAGYQRGLDSSGDFLDTIGEYSVQFKQGGADASEFFSILETGNAGGVLGTDKVADAFKEFGIRIVDDSKLTKDALQGIGISYETLRAGFADGSITTVDAMQLVIEKINEIEDPIERNRAGVALFGTQWEDLTETVTTNVDTQKTKLKELEGAAESLEEQYDTSAAAWEAATRQWDAALVDVGKELNSLGAVALPAVTWAMQNLLIPVITALTGWVTQLKSDIQWVIDTVERIKDYATPQMQPEVSAQSEGAAVMGAAMMGGFSMPVMAAQSATGAVIAGDETHVNVYIEHGGDLELITQATELGVRRAQRTRGE